MDKVVAVRHTETAFLACSKKNNGGCAGNESHAYCVDGCLDKSYHIEDCKTGIGISPGGIYININRLCCRQGLHE